MPIRIEVGPRDLQNRSVLSLLDSRRSHMNHFQHSGEMCVTGKHGSFEGTTWTAPMLRSMSCEVTCLPCSSRFRQDLSIPYKHSNRRREVSLE